MSRIHDLPPSTQPTFSSPILQIISKSEYPKPCSSHDYYYHRSWLVLLLLLKMMKLLLIIIVITLVCCYITIIIIIMVITAPALDPCPVPTKAFSFMWNGMLVRLYLLQARCLSVVFFQVCRVSAFTSRFPSRTLLPLLFGSLLIRGRILGKRVPLLLRGYWGT